MKSEIEKLIDERGKTHGPFPVFAAFSQKLKMLAHCYGSYKLDQEKKEAMDMILHKIARIVTGDASVKDHWDDLAGYATLGSKSIRNDGNSSVTKERQAKTTTEESDSQRPSVCKVSSESIAEYCKERAKEAPYYSYHHGV